MEDLLEAFAVVEADDGCCSGWASVSATAPAAASVPPPPSSGSTLSSSEMSCKPLPLSMTPSPAVPAASWGGVVELGVMCVVSVLLLCARLWVKQQETSRIIFFDCWLAMLEALCDCDIISLLDVGMTSARQRMALFESEGSNNNENRTMSEGGSAAPTKKTGIELDDVNDVDGWGTCCSYRR